MNEELFMMADTKVKIERKQRGSDGAGGSAISWDDVAETMVIMNQLSQDKQIYLKQNGFPATHEIFMAGNIDIQTGDRITTLEKDGIAIPDNKKLFLEVKRADPGETQEIVADKITKK